jgi:hypothetical protein
MCSRVLTSAGFTIDVPLVRGQKSIATEDLPRRLGNDWRRPGTIARPFELGAIHAHNEPFEILTAELNRVRRRESRFLEGTQ